MKKHYLFDVDGTLTPSSARINDDFKLWFYEFCLNNHVYLVTGANRRKTLEQITPEIYNNCKKVFQCSGNEIYISDELIHYNDFKISNEIELWLMQELNNSQCPIKTGNHIDKRNGSINFSILGRNTTLNDREIYIDWDINNNERITIIKRFNDTFPELEARLGGETGIDISEKGKDKGQVIDWFSDTDILYFFGDKMDELGNDYPLAIKNMNGINYHVTDWNHTWNILKKLQ